MLIALAFRAGQVPNSLLAALEAAGRDRLVTTIELGPLTQAEADALLGAPAQPLLYRQSGGNPFYLEELARAGVPPHAGQEADVVGVPPAVAAALGQEVGGLSERARLLAWGGAVAGEPFDLDLAAAAAGLGDDDGADRDRRPARRARRRARPTCRAATASATRSCAARSTTAPARRGGCRRTPAPPRRSPRGRARSPRAPTTSSSRPASATTRRRPCSSRPATRPPPRAPAIAARWFEAALRLLGPQGGDDPFRRLGLLVPLAGALAATGRLERALDTLVDALALVEMADLRVRLIAACAACENLLGRHDAAHARLLAALDALEDQHGAAAAALHAELAADALYDSDFDGDARRGPRGPSRPPARSRTAGWRRSPPRCCASPSTTSATPPRPRRAREESAALLDALPDDQLAMRIDAPYYLGFAEYFCERYDDAIRHLRRGINLSRAVGQGQFVVPMQVGLAHALETRGRLAEAAETADAALEAARLAGNRQLIGWALVADAWMAAAPATSTARARPATRRSRCSKGSTTACSPAPPTPTSA